MPRNVSDMLAAAEHHSSSTLISATRIVMIVVVSTVIWYERNDDICHASGHELSRPFQYGHVALVVLYYYPSPCTIRLPDRDVFLEDLHCILGSVRLS